MNLATLKNEILKTSCMDRAYIRSEILQWINSEKIAEEVFKSISERIVSLDLHLSNSVYTNGGHEPLANSAFIANASIISSALRSLHSGVSKLELSNYSGKDITYCIATIKSIPSSVTQLTLSSCFEKMSAAEIALIIAAIPSSVNFLMISLSSFYKLGANGIAKFLAAIPIWITTLHLKHNIFMNMTSTDIMLVMAAIPPSVKFLIMDCGNLRIHKNLSPQVFSVLTASITSLDLSGAELGYVDATQLVVAITNMSRSITHFNLSSNDLAKNKTVAEIIQILRAIPSSVTHLDLSYNKFYKFNNEELAQIYAAIPSTVTSLVLSTNLIISRQFEEVVNPVLQNYSALPQGMTTLKFRHLSDVQFKEHAIQIATIFAANISTLPRSVKEIDLSHNDLSSVRMDHVCLSIIFKAFLSSIKTVNLSNNWFRENDLNLSMRDMPTTVTKLILEDVFRDIGSMVLCIK